MLKLEINGKYVAIVNNFEFDGKQLDIVGYRHTLLTSVSQGGFNYKVRNEGDLKTVLTWVVRGLRTNRDEIRLVEFRFNEPHRANICYRLLSEIDVELCSMLEYDQPSNVIRYWMKLNSETGKYVTHLHNPWCEIGLNE